MNNVIHTLEKQYFSNNSTYGRRKMYLELLNCLSSLCWTRLLLQRSVLQQRHLHQHP